MVAQVHTARQVQIIGPNKLGGVKFEAPTVVTVAVELETEIICRTSMINKRRIKIPLIIKQLKIRSNMANIE